MCRYFKLNGYYLVTNNILSGLQADLILDCHPLYPDFLQTHDFQTSRPAPQSHQDVSLLVLIIPALVQTHAGQPQWR